MGVLLKLKFNMFINNRTSSQQTLTKEITRLKIKFENNEFEVMIDEDAATAT